MLRVHLPRVSGECTAPATAPSQLSHAGCASNRSNDKAQKRTTNDQLGNSFFPDSRYALKGGSSLVCCESLPSKRKAPRPGRVYRACTLCTVVLPGAEARPQQLARNAVHPETGAVAMRLGVVLLAVVSQQVALRSRRPCVCLGSSHAPIEPVRPESGTSEPYLEPMPPTLCEVRSVSVTHPHQRNRC